jgi:hypothetical protein
MMVVTHPSPYWPNLAPCNFCLFPKMKIKFKDQRFGTIKEIQTESQVLNTLTQKHFQGSFRSWLPCLDHCESTQGDYFEGDGGDHDSECVYFFSDTYQERLNGTL